MKALQFFALGLLLSNNLSALASEPTLPRSEYPRPQFERADWQNLNGEWTYTFDFGKSGMNRHLYESDGFNDKIIVPFCPESKLSGVEYVDFIPAMWYHRQIQIPEDWTGRRIRLNIGGSDFFTAVYVDGKPVGRHWGGSAPFTCDITEAVSDGKHHNLVIRVEDDTRCGTQPLGKQSSGFYSAGCHYTRTTGLWQTVWMEPVDELGLDRVYIVPDLDNSQFIVKPEFLSLQNGQRIEVTVKDGEKVVAETVAATSPVLEIPVKIKKVRL